MATDNILIDEHAIAWTIRVRDPGFDDWDALTMWLEADASHAEAFQRTTMLDEMLPELLPQKPASRWHEGNALPVRRWSFARLGAVAAAILAVVTLSFFTLQSSHYSVETGPGENRTITLADGSKIDLNGDTKITLAEDDPRSAVLENGEALFTVVHNEREPFVVKVGDAVVKDAGTVFNIIRTNNSIEVGVSEGLVIYNPAKEKIALRPGHAVRATDGEGAAETFMLPMTAIGSWQRNQLTYNEAPLGRVAADLARYLGKPVIASGQVEGRRFTGTIKLTKDGNQLLSDIAPVLGVRADPQGDGWILIGGNEAGR